MLYGDYIDLDGIDAKRKPSRQAVTRRTASFLDRVRGARTTRRRGPDAPGAVDGHGTGVSTGRPLPARSFTPRTLIGNVALVVMNPGAWALGLSVLGNMMAGALFLGALLLAPRLLVEFLGPLSGLL